MLEYERLDKILAHLREKQTATVRGLAQKLYASEATIRRDLTELEKRGLIKRLHGGAMLIDGTNHELPLVYREQQNVDAKRALAAKAAQYLQDGQVIFMDASSTVMFLVPHLEAFKSLTIITNGMKTAQELRTLNHKVYCTGGLLLHNSFAYVGEFAADFVRNFNADVCFFSSRGYTEDDLISDASAEETHIRKVMLAQSRLHVFMADASKLNRTYCYNLLAVPAADCCRAGEAESRAVMVTAPILS